MTPEQIANALGGARKDGSGWIALCPVHNDHKPSLRLDKVDGKLLYHCRAGCEQHQVRQALAARQLLNGYAGRDASVRPYSKPVAQICKPPKGASTQSMIDPKLGKPSASWAYRDPDGDVLFYTARYDDADGTKVAVKPWCHDGNGWVQKAWPKPRPLYGLDRLAASPKAPVLVVEGEKCADAACELGYISITWAGGSHAVASTDWSPLQDRDVTIWPDADEPGLKAAEDICRLLGYGAVLDVSDKPRGWDVANAVAEGWTPDQVLNFIQERATPRAETSKTLALPPQPRSGFLSIDVKAPLAVARLFKGNGFTANGISTLHYWQSQFYKYTGSAYVTTDTNAIRGCLYPFLESHQSAEGQPIKPNRRMVDDVQDALRALCYLEIPQAPAWLGGPAPYPLADLIPCANGIVHVPSRKLLAPTPALFNVNATTFDFDPRAPSPKAWLDFLASIFGDDVQAIFALQEFMGLALTTDTSYQKALLIVGPKRSGKGTIARVLTALVGPANTAAPTLAGLGGQFGLQALIGKQLAIISDARLGGRADIHAVTENLLRITGEDFIGVPRKFLSDFTARLPVRFIIMTNEVPALADSSGALPSRFIVLRLTRSFYGGEDIGLTDKLLTELPGVFLWALEGLRRLRGRGAFLQPATGQAMLDQLDELASPIKAFLRARCIVAAGASIECAYLFQRWQEWCRESNREHPGTVQTFGRNLAAAVPGVEAKQQRINGERGRHYVGIRLRSAGDLE